MPKGFIMRIFTIFLLLNIIYSQTRYYPETYKRKDLILPEDDKIGVYQYNLVDAKVLTNEKITLYIKKQGINLDVDDCCLNYNKFKAWDSFPLSSETDLKEILNNATYSTASNVLTYKFPVQKIETSYYEVHHKLWIFDINKSTRQCFIYFNDDTINTLSVTLDGGREFVDLKIEYQPDNKMKITCDKAVSNIVIDYSIKTINFQFNGVGYSPAIALHWTYYKITYATNPVENPNFTLKGKGICSYSNPCVKGYACSRGVCVKCHPSCFDCINGALSTDCDSHCSPISSMRIPNRGSCSLGYVDLSQFDDFDIIGIIPPFRNGRITTSFWFYLAEFPKNPVTTSIQISYEPDYTFIFEFTSSSLTINLKRFRARVSTPNTWYFVKGGCSITHGDCFLFIKYFDGNVFKYEDPGDQDFYGNEATGGDVFISYLETTDYSKIEVRGFKNIVNKDDFAFKFYIKELILFREYLPDPYDNKYFSYENIFSSNFELPEVLFIIPFDELIKNDDKYDVKCYSYTGSKIESSFTITPRYDISINSFYPPKNFRPLNLLGKNEKYLSPDLVEIGEVIKDDNTLISSYDNSPLSCIDNYFLTYRDTPDNDNDINIYVTDDTRFKGSCNLNCDKRKSMLHGLSENKGFCNKRCNDLEICLSDNHDLLHINSQFKCITGYYNSFHHCFDYSTENTKIFYYDCLHGMANIVLDVINYNLKSYIIDFWMKSELYNNEEGETILFYTNQFKIFKKGKNGNYFFYSFENRKEFEYQNMNTNWGHYSIEVYYDPKEKYNHKTTIFLEKNFVNLNKDGVEYSENVLPLEYIYFCNGRKSTCNNIYMTWNGAFYKNLRLFNGNMAQRHILYRYDEYYENYKYLLSSIKFYYPLYGHYIANNLWMQYNSQGSVLNLNTPTNNWDFPQYSVRIPPLPLQCEACSGSISDTTNNRCYKCDNNKYLFNQDHIYM